MSRSSGLNFWILTIVGWLVISSLLSLAARAFGVFDEISRSGLWVIGLAIHFLSVMAGLQFAKSWEVESRGTGFDVIKIDRQQGPDWAPRIPPLTSQDLTDNKIVIVHYWASWNACDMKMASLLVTLQREFADTICFRSCDTDDPGNKEFCGSVANIPFLRRFVDGVPQQHILGLRTLRELRDIVSVWSAT